MGGGKSWWNPFASSPSSPAPAPQPAPIVQTPTVVETVAEKPKAKKKRGNQTVLTTMAGDLTSTNSLKQTLGGS
jgi:hypothetical protein